MNTFEIQGIAFHDAFHASTDDNCSVKEQPFHWSLRLQNTIDWYLPHLEEISKNDRTPMEVYDAVGRFLAQDGKWEETCEMGVFCYRASPVGCIQNQRLSTLPKFA